MVINICKHDGDWQLGYSGSSANYAYFCTVCWVYRLPFNPQLAGKVLRSEDHYIRVSSNCLVAEWTEAVMAYVDRSKDPTKKSFPPIDYKAGEL